MECQEFSILPPEEELVDFLHENVLPGEDKSLFAKVLSLFSDESARKYLIRMIDEPSTTELAEILARGVSWPGYKNEEKKRDVIVTGYSMQNPVLDITLSGIGWWTSEQTVLGVLATWGEVKEIKRVTLNKYPSNPNITSSKWQIKLVKKGGITIPPVVFHAGSDRHWDEKEMWKVYYRGVPKVCYRCLKEGHLGRDCGDTPVNMETLVTQPEFEAAPVETNDQAGEVVPKTFAQVVKDKSFTAREAHLLAGRQQAAQVRQEAEAIARREREKRDEERRRRKNERENTSQRSFSLERGPTGGYGADWAGRMEEEEGSSQGAGKRQHSSPLLKEKLRANKAAKIEGIADSIDDIAGEAPPGHPQLRVGGSDGGVVEGDGSPPPKVGNGNGRVVPPGT